VGAQLAHPLEPPRCRRQAGVGTGVAGRQRRSGEQGGHGGGKTKVGNGSKVMIVVDGNGVPIGLHMDSAQPHERTLAEPTVQSIRVLRRRGRPTTRPKALVADKAYDSAEVRRTLRRRGITPTISPIGRPNRTYPKRGHPIRAGTRYRQHWKVERCFGWMDNCRRLVVRYDCHLHIYRAFCLVAIILWCIDRILK